MLNFSASFLDVGFDWLASTFWCWILRRQCAKPWLSETHPLLRDKHRLWNPSPHPTTISTAYCCIVYVSLWAVNYLPILRKVGSFNVDPIKDRSVLKFTMQFVGPVQRNGLSWYLRQKDLKWWIWRRSLREKVSFSYPRRSLLCDKSWRLGDSGTWALSSNTMLFRSESITIVTQCWLSRWTYSNNSVYEDRKT